MFTFVPSDRHIADEAALLIVNTGVRELKSPVDKAIWEKHFLLGESIRSLAYDLGYCETHMSRKVHSFAKRFATQLILVNDNLRGDEYENCTWLASRDAMKMLESVFHFSPCLARTMYRYATHEGEDELGRCTIMSYRAPL